MDGVIAPKVSAAKRKYALHPNSLHKNSQCSVSRETAHDRFFSLGPRREKVFPGAVIIIRGRFKFPEWKDRSRST